MNVIAYFFCDRCGSAFSFEARVRQKGKGILEVDDEVIGEVNIEEKPVCPTCHNHDEKMFYPLTETEFMTMGFIANLGRVVITNAKSRKKVMLRGMFNRFKKNKDSFKTDLIEWFEDLEGGDGR